MRQHLFRLLKWTIALAGLGGLVLVGYLIREAVRGQRAEEGGAAETPRRAANQVVKLGAELAASHGIQDEPARPAPWAKRAAAYGRVVPNPQATTEVRAAFAGTLRADPDGGWPKLGRRVKPGDRLGWLDIRVGPQERLDLVTKLNEARLKQEGAEEQVRVHKERYDRLKAAGAGVSPSELDATKTQLTEARTQLETAKAAVKEWQQALDAIEGAGSGRRGPGASH